MDVQQEQVAEQQHKTSNSIQLIILKKNKRIKYYQRCEVKVNKRDICIKPYEDDGCESASSTFKVKFNNEFIKYEFGIYCPNNSGTFGFALIFGHRRHCNNVFDVFQQRKAKNGYEESPISNEQLEQIFIKPLIKELRHYSNLQYEFRVFILKLLKSMDLEQKQRLADMIIETGIDQGLLDKILKNVDLSRIRKMPELVAQDESYEVEETTDDDKQQPLSSSSLPPPKRVTFVVEKMEAAEEEEAESSISVDKTRGVRRYQDKRYNRNDDGTKNVSELKDRKRYDANDDDAPPKKVRRRKRKTTPKKSKTAAAPTQLDEYIHYPNFKLISYIQNGISKSRLIIFSKSANQKECYEYFFDFNRQIYICCGCNNSQKCTHATIGQDSNGKDFVQCLKTDHICKLRPYKPDKYKTDYIIRKPNYEFIGIDNALLLFTSDDKESFYSMTYDAHQKLYICMKCWLKKNYIQACVCYDEDGEEYISVRNRKHICSKMNYLVSNESSMNETATLPSYQHVVRNLNKTPKKKFIKK